MQIFQIFSLKVHWNLLKLVQFIAIDKNNYIHVNRGDA